MLYVKKNQFVNDELLNIFAGMVTETVKLYKNLDNIINGKSVSDTDVKQELKALNEYIAYISKKLEKLSNNLNSNEQTILTKIEEEFEKLEKIKSMYTILDELNNISGSEKTQSNIEEILDALFVMLGVEDEDDEYSENDEDNGKIFSASGIKVEQAEGGILISIPQGEIVIQGDIKNIKVNLSEEK